MEQKTKPVLFAAIGFFVVATFSFAYWKYTHFLYNGLDLAIFNQVLWKTLHSDIFGLTIHPPSYLGDHFAPLLLVLVPVYAVAQSPLTLLFLQSLALSLAAIPVFGLAKHFLNERLALFLAIAFLLNPLLWNIAAFEFHAIAFFPVLALCALYYFVKKDFLRFAAWALLVLLVREDASFLLVGLAFIALVERRKWYWFAVPLSVGMGWFAGSLRLIAHANPDALYKFLVYYSWLGNDVGAMMQTAITHPFSILWHLLSYGSISMLVGFAFIFLLLPLWGRRYLLLLALPLAQILLGVAGGSSLVLEMHYSALFIPGFVVASLFGLRRLLRMPTEKNIFLRFFQFPQLVAVIASVALVYNFVAFSPMSALFLGGPRQEDVITATQKAMVARVPAHAAVAASYAFLPFLSGRDNIYAWNYVYTGEQQFGNAVYTLPAQATAMLLDTQEVFTLAAQYAGRPDTGELLDNAPQRVRALLNERGLHPCMLRDTFVLFTTPCAKPIELYRVTKGGMGDVVKPESVVADNVYFSLSIPQVGLSQDAMGDTVQMRLRFRVRQPTASPVAFTLVAKQAGKEVYARDVPVVYGLYPSNEWQFGQVIDAWYTLALPHDVATNNTSLFLRFYTQTGSFVLSAVRSTALRQVKERLGEDVALFLP